MTGSNRAEKGRTGAEHKLRKKRRLWKAAKALLLTAFFLLVLISGSGMLKSAAARFFVNAVQARTSVLEDTLETDFIVIRQEEVFPVPFSGQFETAFREGERIAKGTVVGYLVAYEGTSLEKKSRVPLISPCAGILSFQHDGYENICSTENWPQLDFGRFDPEAGLGKKDTGNAKERIVKAGENLFRIIDNLQSSHLYMEIEAPLHGVFEKNEVDIRLNKLDNLLIRGAVKDIYRDDDKYRILIQIPTLPELLNTRFVSGSVIINKHQGVVIERQVLVTRGDAVGVYLLIKGQVAWQEVTIIGTVRTKAAVSGLKPEDWIVTAPALVKEGQRIFFFK